MSASDERATKRLKTEGKKGKTAAKATAVESAKPSSFCSTDPVTLEGYLGAVDSTEVWKKIMETLTVKDGSRLCLLRGGCQTGKTSLIGAGFALSKENKEFLKGMTVKHVVRAVDGPTEASTTTTAGGPTSPAPHQLLPQADKLELTGPEADQERGNPNTILVVDEAHTWFASESESEKTLLENLLKIQGRKCCVLFLTTSSLEDHKTRRTTPKELQPYQLWFIGPTTDSAMVEKYIKACLADEEESIQNLASKSLFHMCGCNIGLVSESIRALKKAKFISQFQLDHFRAVMGGNGGLTEAQELVIMRLLAVGKVTVDMTSDSSPGKLLVRKGYLVPVGLEQLDLAAPAHPFTSMTNEFTFANAMQAEKMRSMLPNAMVMKAETKFKSALDFTFAFLPALPTWCFISAEGDTNSKSRLLEASLQDGVSLAVASIGIQPFVERASRGSEPKPGHPHAVDVVVRSSKFSSPESPYAIELLSDGSIEKHQGYFRKDGQHHQYSDDTKTRCVVVSFHHSVADLDIKMSKVTKRDIPVVAVAPDLRLGWSFLRVSYFESQGETQKVVLPRFGIPLDCKACPLTVFNEVRPQYWVSVSGVPGVEAVDEPVVTNVFAILKKESLGKDIDGLKKAVLKEFRNALRDKDPHHLTVYPPGKAKKGAALDVGNALNSSSREEPYHVEVK